MVEPAKKWPQNVSGRFSVDADCIDCDLCRTTAADNFARSKQGGYSYVSLQPQTPQQAEECRQAMFECPVEAIADLEEAVA